MDDRTIEELLASRVGEVRVRPVPVDEMLRAARRRRSQRRTVLAAACASVLVVGGAAALARDGGTPVASPPTATPGAERLDVPDGMRLVGSGSVGALVPEGWGMNETRCGTPLKDTVVIDDGGVCLALVLRPDGVESLSLVRTEEAPEGPTTTRTIAGTEALVGEMGCASLSSRRGVLCRQEVHLPDAGTTFVAKSSTRPTSAARKEVEAMVAGIRPLGEAVGVPDFRGIQAEEQGRSTEAYADLLAQLGLAVQVVDRAEPGIRPGYLLDVSPEPGAVLEPGAVVTLVRVAPQRSPVERVRVGMNSDAEAWGDSFADADVRAGATVHLRVGDRIWSYADGPRSRSLAGVLSGDSLEVDGWEDGPNHPHSWIAVRPGRTTVTLTVTADGKVLEVGTVTVVVRE